MAVLQAKAAAVPAAAWNLRSADMMRKAAPAVVQAASKWFLGKRTEPEFNEKGKRTSFRFPFFARSMMRFSVAEA